jgi:hypothetical protein
MRGTTMKRTRSERPMRFIGEDGSLGYRHGQLYELRFVEDDRHFVTIERIDGTGRCPYASMNAFLRNWDPGEMTEEERREEFGDED